MDNTFIYKLVAEQPPKNTWVDPLIKRFMRFFNKKNNHLQLSYKINYLNDYYREQLGLNKKNMFIGNMISIEQAINIYHLLNQVILMKVPGEIVELGCYEGFTAILLQMILDQNQCNKQIHVYDSFQGLPKVEAIDGNFFTEGMLATTEDQLRENFLKYEVKLPHIHAGFFKDTLLAALPEKIAFAHLDGDLYSSIKESLHAIYPRLSMNAVVVIDDYYDPPIHPVNNILPGVKAACDEFFQDKPEKITVLIAGCESHGYFRKF